MTYGNFITSENGGKNIFIDYDSILGFTGEDSINGDVSKLALLKRAFFGISDLITDTLKRYMNKEKNEKFILNYLKASFIIKTKYKELNINELRRLITKHILTDKIYKYIEEYVEDSYIMNLDEQTQKSTKVNYELLFTDYHVKRLFIITEAIRIAIPLVAEYIVLTECDMEETFYVVFMDILEKYQGENIDMKNKIRIFINSRIINTRYSNSVIWKLQEDRCVNPDIMCDLFFKETINGILPKIIPTENPVNYFHVTIRNKLMYKFYSNFETVYTPINLNQVDGEGLTSFDKFESLTNKADESKSIVNNLSILNRIEYIKKRYDINITDDEFIYYKENIKLNSFQEKIIFLYFSKHVDGYENLYNSSRDEYVAMLIILKKILKKSGFRILEYYLTAISEKSEKSNNSSLKNKVLERILSSKKYHELMDTKFKYSVDMQTDMIIKLLGDVNISNFKKLPDYNSEDNENINFDINEFAVEIIDYLSLV